MGTINKKEQRRQALKKQDRRKIERAKITKLLREMKDEIYAPSIQLEFPFTYDHSKGKAL